MSEEVKQDELLEEEVVEETVEETVDVAEEVAESQEKTALELAQEAAEDFENKYLRAHAEMQNIQRRANEERQTLQRYRSQDLAKKILPSLDNLERALSVDSLTEDVKKGLEMVQASLLQALKEEGVEEVETTNFDPNLHMAVQTLPADDDNPADTIAQVFQKGYKLHERLLRPAMVVVYNQPLMIGAKAPRHQMTTAMMAYPDSLLARLFVQYRAEQVPVVSQLDDFVRNDGKLRF